MKKIQHGYLYAAGLLQKGVGHKDAIYMECAQISEWLNLNYGKQGYALKLYGLDGKTLDTKELLLHPKVVVVASFCYFKGKRKLFDQLVDKMWTGEWQLVSVADGFDSAAGFDLINNKLDAAIEQYKIK